MKINISFGERKLQIEINKYKIVKQIRCLIPDLWKENIGNEFQLIYNNIILNDEKMITFYNLNENDEIKIGKLEQFLNNDDVIVELFIAGWNATFIHLIMKKNDRISKIRSMISRIIPEVVNIWNIIGSNLRNNQFVNEIDLIGGYYKLIISDKSDDDDYDLFENDNYLINDKQGKNTPFYKCLEIHDKSLSACYYDSSSQIQIIKLLLKINKTWLISRMNKLKEILSMNEIIAPNLNENLANIPFSFLNSELLFCTIISNRIWKICENYFNTMIYQFTNGLHSGITHLFMTSLQSALIIYIYDPQSDGGHAEKSLRRIVIEACDIFVDFLTSPIKTSQSTPILINYFTFLRPYGEDNLSFTLKANLSEFPKMKINDLKVQLFIPSSIETVFQLKEAISMQTNIPIQDLDLMRNLNNEQPYDEDHITGILNYLVEVNE